MPLMQEYINYNKEMKELMFKQDILFNQMFEFVISKSDPKSKPYWTTAKYSISKCAVGEYLQSQSNIYKRVK